MSSPVSVSAVLSVVALGVTLALAGCSRGSEAAAPGPAAESPAPQVGVFVVAPSEVTLSTELPGRTTPYLMAEVRPQVGGILRERRFEEGRDVTAGQILYQIEASTYRVAQDAARQLEEWFAGTREEFDLELRPRGSDFQRAVWEQISCIPMGRTATYGELAALLGRPTASRAVGAATGRNPISIIVPCHRVVGASGALTGYAGGVERKRWLLDHESRG